MNKLDLLTCSMEYIEEHLRDNIKTQDIADACYCSKSSLEKLFHCVNAISVREYIICRRMTLSAKRILQNPKESILDIALDFGYSSNEAFTRAFYEVWNCNPSEFRRKEYIELHPRLGRPITEGDEYIMTRKNVDISELYDLFKERKNCFFICCDIQRMMDINEISTKAGDISILESMNRLKKVSGEEDVVFRIGGDEFCILTASEEETYAENLANQILEMNQEAFEWEGQHIPLKLYAFVTKGCTGTIRYNDLFTKLHTAIKEGKLKME